MVNFVRRFTTVGLIVAFFCCLPTVSVCAGDSPDRRLQDEWLRVTYLASLAMKCADIDQEVARHALQDAFHKAKLLVAESESKPAGSLKVKDVRSDAVFATVIMIDAWSRLEPDTGSEALKLAVRMVEQFDPSWEKDMHKVRLAGSGTLIDRSLADSLAESINSPKIRSLAYREMAKSWATVDATVKDAYWSRAFYTETEIQDPYERALSQIESVRETVTASPGWVPRFLQEAHQSVLKVKDAPKQAFLLGDLSLAWGRLDRKKTLEIASMIPQRFRMIRCWVYMNAAKMENDKTAGSGLLDLVEKEARQASFLDKDRLWMQVAGLMAGVDTVRAEAWMSSRPDIGGVYRNKALSMAAMYAGENDFGQALEWAESVTEPLLRIHTLTKIAHNGQNHIEALEAALIEAEKQIDDDLDDTDKANLAEGWSYLSDERALEWAGLIDDNGIRAKTHATIGKIFAERGRTAAVDTAWLRALTAAESLPDETGLTKAMILIEIASIQATVSPGQAKAIFETARHMLAG